MAHSTAYTSSGSSFPGPGTSATASNTPYSTYQSSYQFNASAPPAPTGTYSETAERTVSSDHGAFDSTGDYGSRYTSASSQGYGKGYGKDSQRPYDREERFSGDRPRFDRDDGGRDFRDGGKGKGFGGKGWVGGKGYEGHKGGNWNFDGFKGGYKGFGKGKGYKGGFDRDRDEGRWENRRDEPQDDYGKREVKREEKPEERRRSPTPPPRSRSIELKRSIKISAMPLTSMCRQYQDLKLRYRDLHISGDFTKLIASWTLCQGVTHELMLKHPPKFNLGSELAIPVQKNLPATLDSSGTKHNAKVVLLTVDGDSSQHLTLQLKFLVCKVEKGLLCPGGAWNEVDGSDPYDDAVLRNTAIRTVKNMCGVDLSTCAQWIKFTEIWYHRPEEGADLPEMKERVVIFVPDCWNHPDLSFDVYYQLKGLEEKGEGEARDCLKENNKEASPTSPEENSEQKAEASNAEQVLGPSATNAEADRSPGHGSGAEEVTKEEIRKEADERARKRNTVCKPMVISLDGLLDYDIDDNYEKTAEVSLFAEGFHEMLQQEFGQRILHFLRAKKELEKKEKELRRAKRKAEDAQQQESKKRKQEEEEKPKEPMQIGTGVPDGAEGSHTPNGGADGANHAEGSGEKGQGDGEHEQASSERKCEQQCDQLDGSTQLQASEAEAEGRAAENDAIKPGQDGCEVGPEETEEQQLEAKEKLSAKKAFQFFDKSDFGYLKAGDVEKIFYNLDAELSRRVVHGLVSSFRGERDRVEYLSLCRR
eukprot:GGOE01019401.1.p1 GENE.GGOE01019401.1~~GGOE01019401.1.p1  ORF type:complete len:851 (-),score=124.55 GGOE01019401.1:128-2407(-)